MAEQLKPCPFCGGEATKSQGTTNHGKEVFDYIECVNCEATATPEMWNKRNRHEKLKQQVMERLRPCLHCQHTGWIHTDDDIPDQMCPYCFVGKAVLKCYRETTKIQLGDYDNLKAKADKHDALVGLLRKSLKGYRSICKTCTSTLPRPCKCKWQTMIDNLQAALEGEQE